MKNILNFSALYFFCLIGLSAQAQDKTQGQINYIRKTNFRQIMIKQKHITQEDKDRMSLMKGDTWDEKYVLTFNKNISFYTLSEEEDEANKWGYSWRQPELKFHRDFEQQKQTDVMEMFGKTYIVDDSIQVPQWKIKTQIKMIQNMICMKAITVDTVKKVTIVAWFTDAIPAQVGPERLHGLPGTILELDMNDGDVVVTAEKIDYKPVTIKKPTTKGKKIKEADYQKLIADKIKKADEARENVWWSIRY
jgi:GLPGLI family protein